MPRATVRSPRRHACMALLAALLALLSGMRYCSDEQMRRKATAYADEGTRVLGQVDETLAAFLQDGALADMGVANPVILTRHTAPSGLDRMEFKCGGDLLSGQVAYDAERKVVTFFSVLRAPSGFTPTILPIARLRDKATEFAKRWYPMLWAGADEVKMRLRSSTVSDTGCVHFTASAVRRGVFLGGLDLWLSVDGGQVITLALHDEGLGIELNDDEILPQDAAVNAAHTALRKRNPELWTNGQLWHAVCGVRHTRSKTGLDWALTFVPAGGLHPSGFTPVGYVRVNAGTGEIEEVDETDIENGRLEAYAYDAEGAEAIGLPERSIKDTGPAWIGTHGLLVGTLRLRTGRPAWRQQVAGVCHLDLNTGVMAMIEPAFLRPVGSYAACANPLLAVAVDASRRATLLDLTTGGYSTFGGPERPVEQVAFSPDGREVAFCAERRHGDRDIFLADVDRSNLEVSNQRRIARLDGADYAPVFSPSRDRVYFAHRQPGREGQRPCEVWRVNANGVYWENQAPERVVAGLGNIGRLSFFPDGRLVVWHTEGLDVVDVEAGTREALRLPELRDADLPEGQPLKMRDPVVSPDGKKLAFSGFRWSGRPEDPAGWYIY